MATEDDSVRIRLEGRLELLEAALPRYRLLQLKVLGRLRWKQAVRQHAALVRELAELEPRVDEALAQVFRHAEAEGWKSRSEAVQCANDVKRQRAAVATRVRVLLDENTDGAPLAMQLFALEKVAVHTPRLVLPGQRMATAVELLPGTLPELKRVAGFGEKLERIFKRPDGLGRALPFEAGELEALEAAWPEGEAALAEAWARVAAIDAAGTLTRYLQRLGRRMPMHASKNGADALLHAEFWKSYGLSRLSKLLAPRVSPLTVQPNERFAVARWLWAAERNEPARLMLEKSRAALYQLAFALTAVAPGEALPAAAWDHLEALAATADEGEREGDWEKLADNLQLLLRVLAQRKPQRGTAAESETLVALVCALRRASASPRR